jgi:uncharacterized protein (TIGR03083 family)
MLRVMTTAPTPELFLRCLQADSARISELARAGRTQPVPSCPGWTVDDVLDHVAHVYLHKVEALRTNARPEPWPPDLSGRDSLELYDEATAALLRELAERGPDAPSWTWWPADQTSGFWFRRMAQEAAVHRVDVELAHDAVTPIDPSLAVDGVDEVLRLFLADPYWADHTEVAIDGSIRVTAGGRAWTVGLGPSGTTVADGAEGSVDAEIAGEPEDVLLWLWGRRGDEAVDISGDRATAGRFRQRLAEATG